MEEEKEVGEGELDEESQMAEINRRSRRLLRLWPGKYQISLTLLRCHRWTQAALLDID